MAGDSHIREQALREVIRNYPIRVRCRILNYRPEAEPAPTVVATPYTALETIDSYPDQAEWWQENAYEFAVNFPGNQMFHLDADKYDVYVDPPLQYARECYPVANAEYRRESARIPDGWTEDEVIDQAVDPNSIQMRIIRSKQRIDSFKECDHTKNPMWARQEDVWFGGLRQKLDQQMFDIWSAPHRYIARFHHKATTFVAEQFRHPMSDGTESVWRDRIEHPFQRQFGSSAVINYPRFMATMGVDPGYIVGVILNLREFFRSLDYDDGQARVEHYRTYEVIDYQTNVPEV